VTTSTTAALTLPAIHPGQAAPTVTLAERTIRAVQRRADRFRLALLTLVLFLPLLATAVLGGR
jgi:hypothetical protein